MGLKFYSVLREENLNYQIEYLSEDMDYLIYSPSSTIVEENHIFKNFFNFAKKLFSFVISKIKELWTKFINFVKRIYNKIINFFKKMTNKYESNDKPIYKASFCLEYYHASNLQVYSSISDVINAFTKSCNKITEEIKKISKRNVTALDKLEKITLTNIKEETVEDHAVIERVHLLTQKFHPLGTPKDIYDNSHEGIVFGETTFDEAIHENIKVLTTKDIESIYNLKDDMHDIYNALVDTLTDNLIYLLDDRKFNEYININNKIGIKNVALNRFYTQLKTYQYDKRSLRNILSTSFNSYFTTDAAGQAKLKNWLEIQISYNNTLIETLNNMLSINYAILQLTLNDANIVKKDIKNYDFKSFSDIINNNKLQFIKRNNEVWDFSNLGLGVLVNSKDIANNLELNANEKFLNMNYCNLLLHYMTNYDITIQAHETIENQYRSFNDINNKYSLIETEIFRILYEKEHDLLYKLYSVINNADDIKEILYQFTKIQEPEQFNFKKRKLPEDVLYTYNFNLRLVFNNYFKRHWKININFRNFIKSYIDDNWFRWTLSSPVCTPKNNGPFTDVELLIYQLWRENYHNVMMLVCNANYYKLHPYFYKNNMYDVTVSKDTRLM